MNDKEYIISLAHKVCPWGLAVKGIENHIDQAMDILSYLKSEEDKMKVLRKVIEIANQEYDVGRDDAIRDGDFRAGFKEGYLDGYNDANCGREYDNSADKEDFDPDDWRYE